jgi:hypothetical protein
LTILSDTADFAGKLRSAADEFRRHETLIRKQYARVEVGAAPPRNMLERPTRRFLVDGLLRALDWDPDSPAQLVEEARAKSEDDDRLYFDYLGIAPQTQAPVLLVEAKGFDVALPRKPRGPKLDALGVATLIAEAVDALKRGDETLPIISEWAELLRDLHTYIGSLDAFSQANLRRAIITAGGWTIVFREPIATFRQSESANIDHIVCFISLDDMLLRHTDLYNMLHRSRLVDTLPLTLKVPEALRMIRVDRIGECFQAVLVATTMSSGARRQQYPTRSVYPALVVGTGDRWFTIVDYDRPIEEPKRSDSIAAFLAELERNGTALLGRLRGRFGRGLNPAPIEQFPGFPTRSSHYDLLAGPVMPVAGSTAARQALGKVDRRAFVSHSGEAGAPAEYIVVTGTAWFYKADRQAGGACDFHLWKSARDENVAAESAHSGYIVDSFTEDGQDRHCAHADLLGLRADRCHVRAIETHLCCKACIFESDCWSTDQHLLPCPTS